MNPLLTSTAIGLLAAWPASGLGWLLGAVADRVTRDPGPRSSAWAVATALAPAAVALVAGASLLPGSLTAPVVKVVLNGKISEGAGAVFSQVQVGAPLASNLTEALMAALLVGAVGGLGVAVARQVRGHLRLKAIVRQAATAPHELSLAVGDAASRLGCGRPDILVSDQIQQPLLAGLFNPVILLPTDLVAQLDADRLLPICVHELAHLKRRDNWRLLVEDLSSGLLWSVAPQAALRTRAAAVREERCDAIALTNADVATRRAYAESLVRVLRARAAPGLHPAFTGKSRRSVPMRLEAITNPSPPASRVRKAAIGGLAILIVALASGGAMALTQKKVDRTNYARSTVSDDQGLVVDIIADKSEKIRPSQATDRFGAPIQTTIFSGGVELQGRFDPATTRVLLNGVTPPAGFEPAKLPKGSIQRIEVTDYDPAHTPKMVLNIIM